MEPNVMQRANGFRLGAGPGGARCGECVHLLAVTSQPRPSDHARHHAPITLFRCSRDGGQQAWSTQYIACGLFRRAES